MPKVIEISTGTEVEVPQAKADSLVKSGRYIYEGQKVEISPDLAIILIEKEKETLIKERAEFEEEKAQAYADITIKKANLEKDRADFEVEKRSFLDKKRNK